MSELPWDRFPEEEVELPYKPPDSSHPFPSPPVYSPTTPPTDLPPQPLPIPVSPPPKHAAPPLTDVDVKDLARDLLAEAMDYAKSTVGAVIKGQDVDITHPTVTAVTATGKELVVADARNRSARTLIQGLIFDLFAALLAAIAMLNGLDPFQKETWILFGTLVLKSFVSAGISYFMRLRVAPTVRTAGEKMQVMPVMVPKPEEAT